MDYTPQELMVTAAAREIRDGEIVFTGMRLPLIAFALAKELHAPNAIGLFESGLMRDTPSPELLYTMGDPPNIRGALWATRMVNIMGMLSQGCVDMGFIGGAEVDQYGNLNTSYVSNDGLVTKLPGSGGAADIACLSKRLVAIMAHEKRRFVPRVSYVTSPGNGAGANFRARVGLPRGRASAVITTLGILRFDEQTGAAFLASYHPGQTLDAVRAATGWDLRVAPDARETQPPAPRELEIIRRYDPQGFWTR